MGAGNNHGTNLGYQCVGNALAASGLVAVLPAYRKSVKVVYPTLALSFAGLLSTVFAIIYNNVCILVPAVVIALIGPLFVVLHFDILPHLREGSWATHLIDKFAQLYVSILDRLLSSESIRYPCHVEDVAAAVGW